MNATQRKQLNDARKRMIDLDLTTGQIAELLGTSSNMISQLIHGHNFYPRFAAELKRRWAIVIPDTRELRRKAAKAK